MWVNTALTTNTSITCEWTLADGEGTSFMADQQFSVTSQEHFTQQAVVIPAKALVHNLTRKDRRFDVIGANVPGVHYNLLLKQFFNGEQVQYELMADESLYPSEIYELSHLRVVTEHTLQVHWEFQGTASTITIWHQPAVGSCPCTLNAIGVLSYEVTGLVAGQDYTFYMQLTSAYGKKGPVTSFMMATFTDVIQASTLVGTADLLLSVSFESGTGSEVRLHITGQLSGIDRHYYHDYARINKFQFGELFPGDLYTINMWAVSKGDENTAVIRNYTFYDSTYPLQPTIVTEITVTEHTIHFRLSNPVYFSKQYIWIEPSEGSCPCQLDNSSINDVTITNLIAGGEYKIHILAESAFGRNSSQLSFVQSLYTDEITVTNVITTRSLQTDVQFESGVGSTVEMELECLDLPLSWRQKNVFELNLAFSFDIVPGSSYVWKIIATSRGSNPLQRNYTFSDTNPPVVPISLVEAASTLETYDIFVLTVGSETFCHQRVIVDLGADLMLPRPLRFRSTVLRQAEAIISLFQLRAMGRRVKPS
ncbi:uncharacterized protein LOC142334949 [Convolutriloba macropyga]|uniref:uncharacterized protein LOC142334949 n=1 Tax=Convolutriloba macropyga TaxID=536237 RepID=UPI003F526966